MCLKKISHLLLSIILAVCVILPLNFERTHAAISLKPGSSYLLSAREVSTSYPNPIGLSKTYMWSVNTDGIVSLEKYGSSCYVRAISTGTVTVTCMVSMSYNEYDSRLGTYRPRYEQAHAGSWAFEVVNPNPTGVHFTSSSLVLNGTNGKYVGYSLEPSNAIGTVSFSSDNTSIATVDSDGYVRAKGIGSTVIRIRTSNGYTDTCTVTINRTVDLLDSDILLKKGSSKTLSVTYGPSNVSTTIKWSSSNPKIATVNSNGKVTSKSTGTVTISATANGVTDKCKIKVVTAFPSKISFNGSSARLAKGKTKQLTYKISPSNAATKLTFSSSNTSVATVNSKGKITVKGKGKAIITVKTHNGMKDTYTINGYIQPTKVTLNKSSVKVEKGKTYTLKSTLSPSTSETTLKYSSSNTNVATVNSKGKITAKKVGTTTITVKSSNGKTDTCKVTVYVKPTKISLNKSNVVLCANNDSELKYFALKTKFTPSNATTTLKYSSSNTKVATVDSNGLIEAVGKGTATITVKSSNGKNATCKVKVYLLPKEAEVYVGEDNEYLYDYSYKHDPITVLKGKTVPLTTKFLPSSSIATVKYVSSNSSGLKVSSTGLMKGLKTGKYYVSVYIEDKYSDRTYCIETLHVSVVNRETECIETSILKSTQIPGFCDYYECSYSKKGIVSIDGHGYIDTLNVGTTVVTVKSFGHVVGKYTITVFDATTEISICSEDMNLNFDNIVLEPNEKKQLQCVGKPVMYGTPTWSSSDTNIFTVDKNGMVTAKNAGVAYVKCNYLNLETEQQIIVSGDQIVDMEQGDVLIDLDECTIEQGTNNKIYFNPAEPIIFVSETGDTLNNISVNSNTSDETLKLGLLNCDVETETAAFDLSEMKSGRVEIYLDTRTTRNMIIIRGNEYAIKLPEGGLVPVKIYSEKSRMYLGSNGIVVGGDYDISNVVIDLKYSTIYSASDSLPMIGCSSNYSCSNITIKKAFNSVKGGSKLVGSVSGVETNIILPEN